MPFQPKKTKFLKSHIVIYKKKATSCNKIEHGEYALASKESAFVKSSQLEAVRLKLSKTLIKNGKYWFRIFPHMPRTKKQGVRMGSGKGPVEFYYAPVCDGTIICEVAGINKKDATELLKQCGYKLPFKYRILQKERGKND